MSESAVLKHPLRYLRQMYDQVMRWADHRYGVAALGFFSAIEAIFFPVPVDPLLLAMGTAKPRRAIWFGLVATFFSVLGGFLGYLLGYWFWDVTQEFFLTYVFSVEKFDLVMAKFNENAFMAIFLAGLTPIPYKVFTVAAGVAHLDLAAFFLGSALGRSLRFLLIGTLLFFFGPQIRTYVEKYFERLTLVAGVVLVVLVALYRLLR